MPTRAASLNEPKRPWERYAILGSGRLAVVYSDDSRITRRTHARGIQHLYFDDYTADYVSSTGFDLLTPTVSLCRLEMISLGRPA